MIITNNPDVRDAQLQETEFVTGTPLDVLTRASALVEQGFHLVTAPLSANNRLNRNPYRSIVLASHSSWHGNDGALLDQAVSHLALQGFLPAGNADADYRWMDLEHLKTALEEDLSHKAL